VLYGTGGGGVVIEWCQEVWRAYSAVDDVLISRIIVDIYGYAAEGGDFGGEFVEARVVLLFALVGLRHCCAVQFQLFSRVVESALRTVIESLVFGVAVVSLQA
jgi:hypothetical protein